MNFNKRTKNCGELRIEHQEQSVILNGWVNSRRDLGGLIFIDLRDRYGITQVIIEPTETPELAERAKEIRSEYVLWFKGYVRKRENPNNNIPTGLIELVAEDFGIINKAELTPFEIEDDTDANEELRLKFRYLDLRRPILQKNFIIRNKVYQVIHRYFDEKQFLEIETPVLMKSTPEGARDFLVPSRINKGKFYALPQSPQIYKQILMIAGYDRYMQIVKCFRDEDLRSDRQPEFTQIDLEMSFIDIDDIIEIIEGLFIRLWKEINNYEVQAPFLRMTYADAMSKYGSDKPDNRFGMLLNDISEIVSNSEFKVFTDTINAGGSIIALNAEGCANYSRKQLDELTDFAKKYGAKGLAWLKLSDGTINSPIAKFLNESEINAIIEKVDAKDGDLILISSDKTSKAQTILGALRLEIARRENIFEKLKKHYSFLWVLDFPLLEYDDETKRYYSMHHPFTSPKEEDLALIDSEPENIRAKAYDLVCNGAELGGGSIRIHNNEIQEKMFSILGLDANEIESKFGFLIKALKYGAPPHGGIALGLDRIIMSLAKTENIRDVIAFPKTTSGLSLMDGCPSFVDEQQLYELGIKLLEMNK